MEQLLDEYMVAWKQMQTEKQVQGRPTAETVTEVKDFEDKINAVRKNIYRTKK